MINRVIKKTLKQGFKKYRVRNKKYADEKCICGKSKYELPNHFDYNPRFESTFIFYIVCFTCNIFVRFDRQAAGDKLKKDLGIKIRKKGQKLFGKISRYKGSRWRR